MDVPQQVLEGQKNTIGILSALLRHDHDGVKFLTKEPDTSTLVAMATLATIMLVEREGGQDEAAAWLQDSAMKLAVQD